MIERRGLPVKDLRMPAEHLGGLHGQRAVNHQRDAFGDQPLVQAHVILVHQHLRPADGERRNNEFPAATDCLVDDLRELLAHVLRARVLAAAVGALADQVVTLGQRIRIAKDLHAFAAKIARINDRPRPARRQVGFDFHPARTEHVPRLVQAGPHARPNVKRFAEPPPLKQFDRLFDVTLVVQRLNGRVPLLDSLLIPVLGIFLLDMCRIGQEDFRQVARRRRGEDRASEPVLDQQRQPPAVIHVGMGQHYGPDLPRVAGQIAVLGVGLGPMALKQPAIQADHVAVDLDQMHRPGDFLGRPVKPQLCLHCLPSSPSVADRIAARPLSCIFIGVSPLCLVPMGMVPRISAPFFSRRMLRPCSMSPGTQVGANPGHAAGSQRGDSCPGSVGTAVRVPVLDQRARENAPVAWRSGLKAGCADGADEQAERFPKEPGIDLDQITGDRHVITASVGWFAVQLQAGRSQPFSRLSPRGMRRTDHPARPLRNSDSVGTSQTRGYCLSAQAALHHTEIRLIHVAVQIEIRFSAAVLSVGDVRTCGAGLEAIQIV